MAQEPELLSSELVVLPAAYDAILGAEAAKNSLRVFEAPWKNIRGQCSFHFAGAFRPPAFRLVIPLLLGREAKTPELLVQFTHPFSPYLALLPPGVAADLKCYAML
jgi:hypothetical protein